MTTIRDALREAVHQFTPGSETASLDAQVLLGAVLERDRAYLLAHGDEELPPAQAAQFADFVKRRAGGEPVAYILGRRAFYDHEFIVTRDVLIPRPETELLLEAALEFAKTLPQCVAADIGTGSGALAVTFAAHYPQAQVCAIDISPKALAVARRNAAKYKVGITFYEGDLLTPLIDRHIKVNVLMANLPYVASSEMPRLPVSLHEPRLALDGGPDGLNLVRRLLDDLPGVCLPGTLALLEIGADQGEIALALAHEKLSPQSAELLKDYAGLDRILQIQM